MSTTLSPAMALEVFETPADWERWTQSMTPSGGNAHRALEPLRSAPPSGADVRYFEYLVRGGLAVGLVMAAATAASGGTALTQAPANMVPVVASGPAVAPRRREDEMPAEQAEPSSSLAATPAGVLLPAAERSGGETAAAAITAEDQIAAVQEGLSLSVTQLAEILRVARGTVYGWMSGEVELPRDHGTAQRLRDLYRVARDWRTRSDETLGRLVAAPLGDDQPSLLALLATAPWDEEAIDQALTMLADRLGARRRERRQAQDRGLGRARPADPETVELERLRLRGLT